MARVFLIISRIVFLFDLTCPRHAVYSYTDLHAIQLLQETETPLLFSYFIHIRDNPRPRGIATEMKFESKFFVASPDDTTNE